MSRDLRWRIITAIVVVLTGIVILVPNFLKKDQLTWWPTKSVLKKGLDIQGGLHLVMGVDIAGMLDETITRTVASLKTGLDQESIPSTVIRSTTNKDWINVDLANAADESKLTSYLDKNFVYIQVLEKSGAHFTLKFLDTYIEQTKERTMGQAIETIRNRIDEFGVSEPSITAQGKDRILVQLPGLEDATRAKELINRTARLEFMLVESKTDMGKIQALIGDAEKAGNYNITTLKYSEYIKKINQDLKGRLPERTKLYFGKNESAEDMAAGKVPYLLELDHHLGGDTLKDAFVTTGQYNEPEVSLSFNPDGTKTFAEITGNNVGRRLAVVLDDVVYTAPNLQTKIANGQARITLGGGRDFQKMMDEAKTISMVLRAGALPAKLEQLEERTIGPTLGADSIKKGVQASLVAALLVVVFMLVYYRVFGLIADVALAVNVLLTLAMLSLLDATLTLPGIAGIALTIGIAVDANVIIFERIKEELEKGTGVQTSIQEGFTRAFSAILDANVVTAFTCAILIYFGNGPVRGFGVTLLIGICTSLFTAVFLTRTIVEALMKNKKTHTLSI